jgi:hypothetical protein
MLVPEAQVSDARCRISLPEIDAAVSERLGPHESGATRSRRPSTVRSQCILQRK